MAFNGKENRRTFQPLLSCRRNDFKNLKAI